MRGSRRADSAATRRRINSPRAPTGQYVFAPRRRMVAPRGSDTLRRARKNAARAACAGPNRPNSPQPSRRHSTTRRHARAGQVPGGRRTSALKPRSRRPCGSFRRGSPDATAHPALPGGDNSAGPTSAAESLRSGRCTGPSSQAGEATVARARQDLLRYGRARGPRHANRHGPAGTEQRAAHTTCRTGAGRRDGAPQGAPPLADNRRTFFARRLAKARKAPQDDPSEHAESGALCRRLFRLRGLHNLDNARDLAACGPSPVTLIAAATGPSPRAGA